MPVFIAALLGGLIQAAGTLVGRVLLSIGLGYVSFTGMNTSLDWLRSQVVSSVAGLPSQMVGVLSALQVGAGLSVLFSAFAVKLVLDGMSAGGAIRKLVLK